MKFILSLFGLYLDINDVWNSGIYFNGEVTFIITWKLTGKGINWMWMITATHGCSSIHQKRCWCIACPLKEKGWEGGETQLMNRCRRNGQMWWVFGFSLIERNTAIWFRYFTLVSREIEYLQFRVYHRK